MYRAVFPCDQVLEQLLCSRRQLFALRYGYPSVLPPQIRETLECDKRHDPKVL